MKQNKSMSERTMTERIEPYILTKHNRTTGQAEISVVDPRCVKQKPSEDDRKIFELCKLSMQYESSNDWNKALESILLACQQAPAIQSKSAYRLLIQRLMALKQFNQLPGLVQLGKRLEDEATLARIAPILAKLGLVDQAIALVQGLNLGEHCAEVKAIMMAKVAGEITSQHHCPKVYHLIEQSLKMAQDLKHSKHKALAEIALQTAHAGFYEKAVEVAQELVPNTRRTATLAEIKTIRSRS